MPLPILSVLLALSAVGGEASVAAGGLEQFGSRMEAACSVAGELRHTASEWQEANRTLVQGLADPQFVQLSEAQQGWSYSCAGWGALRLDDDTRARDMFAEATRLDPETAQNWLMLAEFESGLGHHDAAAKSLTAYLKLQPDKLDDSKSFILRLVDAAEPGSQADLELLQLLFQKNWRSNDSRSSEPWYKLALELIRRDQPEAARAAIAQIAAPDTLVKVRSDKRFDGLFDPEAPEFDPVVVANRRVDELKVQALVHPRKLETLVELCRAMLVVGMDQAVLEISDRVSQAANSKSNPAVFDDMDQMVWIMNLRATALIRVGRTDESVALMEKAAGTDVDGEPNVNQVLNLASVYCDLGRPKEALSTAAKSGPMSGYGLMVQNLVRHCGALLKGDRKAAARALGYLRAHRAEGKGIFLLALTRADQLDEAARELVERLESEATRDTMLLDVQDFREPKAQPPASPWDGNWDKLMAREDVRAALAKVGRRQYYDYFGN